MCYYLRKFILWTKYLIFVFGTGSVDLQCVKFSTFVRLKQILDCL